MHAHLDRTGLESIVFSATSAVILSSCNQTWWRSPFVETAAPQNSEAINASTVTKPFDAELLEDLRGLGKPPSFDVNDAEYQDFRFSFRMHMSLVSSVSHVLIDTQPDFRARTSGSNRP